MSALVVAAMLQGTAAPTVGLAKLSQHELNAMSTLSAARLSVGYG